MIPMKIAAYPPELQDKKLILALTGGVACYKSAELTRLLVKAGAQVQVVMTESATRFITPLTLQALSGKRVITDIWDGDAALDAMPHIHLTRDADAILIAPASADAMAALAQGRADDFLSLLCLARPIDSESTHRSSCPLLLAPAMNREMWSHPATQRNLATLRADGAVILGPAEGDQACGEFGAGRMLEPEDILEDLIAFFQPKLLLGRKVLITAGPTFEPIDPIRGLTNHSSGKMGFALARAAREAGANVTLVSGPVHLPTPRGVHRIDVQTAQAMFDAVLPLAAQQHIFIATAAVADWRPARYNDQKIKKSAPVIAANATDTATATKSVLTLELHENPDILAAVAALPNPPFCVGFAAETENLAQHARIKRERKNIPLIVGNLGPATFGADDNRLLLVDAQGSERCLPADGSSAPKWVLARALVNEIARNGSHYVVIQYAR
jgi:phosphopantothenoylcysteine decarboxylase/phosphopantothenate--cysteine ligase